MIRQKEQSPEEFWRDYEQQTGEKVLARSMGRYLSGWDEFDRSGDTHLWGLLILTDRCFRFHHFPQTSWLDTLTRFNSNGSPPKEKTFCIPREQINSTELRREKNLWRRLFAPHPPLLIIRYRNGEGQERELSAETNSTAQALADLPGSVNPSVN